ncbi:MAG TPA: FadR family transcriptional regulator [Anaerolineae bacterium]|nr:FadR family transcriptional regulator [Anaerolineae bacterium]
MSPNEILFRAVQNQKLFGQINRQLLKTIVAGHYKAGDLLPPERDHADMFGVSRVVVREALGSLRDKGIVSIKQGRGTTVNPIDEWNTLDPEVLMLLYGDELYEKLIQLRGIIEPEFAALAAENITPEELEKLRKVSDLPESDTVEQHVERDTMYHLLIAKATHNPVLLIVLSSISEMLRESRRRTFAVHGELAKARYWHKTIFEAIEAHIPQAAREAMSAHMQQVQNGLERFNRLNQEDHN